MFEITDSPSKKNIISGLDIGTSKIGAVIGEMNDSSTIHILGAGISTSQGLRQGVVINLDEAVESIKKAVHEAQLTAGIKIDDVVVGIAGDHIRSFNSRGMIAVSRPNQGISQDDVDKVLSAAKAIALPVDREVLHILPQEFIVDNQGGIDNPVGINGVRLEAEIHIVTGAIASAQNIVRSVKKAGLKVIGLVLEPLASSYAVLDESEKNLGVALIDLGGGTSDLIIFYNGSIRHTSVICLGGQNVTNDIALGLRTPLEQAEEIKKKFGCCHSGSVSKIETFTVPGIGGREPGIVNKEVLTKIIQPRMEEIFSLASKEIKRSDYSDLLGAGVVLTGGGSLLNGSEQLAEEIFGIPAKIGIPGGVVGLQETVTSPIFATAIGLLLWRMKNKNKKFKEFGENEDKLFSRIFQLMKNFVDDNF